ncbi:MAG: NAD(P)H-dependent oxidoreductase [Campylobacterota bacterium]|nr:NAD(P)H-dependent oxidoreductase [Campylobacterota bacterium]
MNKDFLEAMNFRHACKVFDENKKIEQSDLEFILDMGRKSPSSFGMEPWKFLVVQNKELKEKLRPFCWNQAQITTCSDLVIILAKIDDLKPENKYVPTMFNRREMPKEKFDFYIDLYAKHLSHTMSSDENILSWSAKQCYIALGNMMTAAASIGIDSCPIEGFEKENIEKILKLDTSKYQLAVLVPLGYRINEQSTQLRLESSEVIEYI